MGCDDRCIIVAHFTKSNLPKIGLGRVKVKRHEPFIHPSVMMF